MAHSFPSKLTRFRPQAADLPVVPEVIDNSSDAPAIGLVGDRPNYSGACCDGWFKSCIRIFTIITMRTATGKRLWAEIQVLRRFVCDPELSFSRRKLRDYRPILVEAKRSLAPKAVL